MTNEKIPCYIMCFFMHENFIKCVDSMLANKDLLDFKIIENYSKYTDSHFKPYIKKLIQENIVSEYFLFKKNISNNAADIILKNLSVDDIKSKYILITDGDLIFEPNFLTEEINILEKNKEVFCAASDIDMSNLPNVPGAKKWNRIKKRFFKNYNEGYTGFYGNLFRTSQFFDVLEILKKENKIFLDSHFHKYCKTNKMKWGRTKKTKVYHLTWDNYSNPNDEYNIWKSSIPLNEHWNTLKICEYKKITKSNINEL